MDPPQLIEKIENGTKLGSKGEGVARRRPTTNNKNVINTLPQVGGVGDKHNSKTKKMQQYPKLYA